MADESSRDAHDVRVSARTSERVSRMSDEERDELARILAGRKAAGLPLPGGRAAEVPARPDHRASETQDPAAAAAAARIAGELVRTERRLDRLEATVSRGRYQTGGTGAPSGRYGRLLRRADRLERQLRALRCPPASRRRRAVVTTAEGSMRAS